MLPPLHKVVAGKDSGRLIVLLHPLAGSAEFWSEPLAELGAVGRVIAYDQRGFGRSPVPKRPWSLEDHAHDLEIVRRECGFERLTLAGVAVGGMIAVTYTTLYPERVEALVLCNPAVRIGRERLLARIEQARTGGIDAIAMAAVEGAFTELPRDERFQRYLRLFRLNDVRGYEMTALGIQNASIDDWLGDLHVPVLVLAGAHDRLVSPSAAADVAARIVGARFELIDDAAHMVPFQSPAAFARHTRAFLAS
jgi:3-oxoadipate enol-lactonase